jgi:hypothetical protein
VLKILTVLYSKQVEENDEHVEKNLRYVENPSKKLANIENNLEKKIYIYNI